MPLINVNNTADPQNSIAPNVPFQSVPVNVPASSVEVANEPKITEYVVPSTDNLVEEPDIKESFSQKLNNLPNIQEANVELPPLATAEELNNIQLNLPTPLKSPETFIDAVPQESVLENIADNSVEQSFPQSQNTTEIPVAELKKQIPEVESPIIQEEKPVIEVKPDTIDALPSGILELDQVLALAIKRNASDIHFTPGYRTMIRVDGDLEVASSTILTPSIVNQYVMDLLRGRPDMQMNAIKEMDLTYTMEERRFRVNIFRQMGNFSITLRIIPERILTIGELGLPEIINEFPTFPNGLVLVTGPTGSGKSTTIAAILNQINLTLPKHIVTLEDPIEFVFPKGVGLVDQRESGIDFNSWNNALRSVLRQDPDVVLVGEMRDLETVEAALQIAETGHLVFATLHTNGAAETINRVIDIFEANKQDQIRVQLSSVLRAVVSQKLIQVSTGGRKAVVELLMSTPSVKNAIRDKKTFQINNIIQTSSDVGMISMEKSLVKMVRDGLISKDKAKSMSVNPNEIDILLK